jgi:hypothetical protein
VGWSMVVTYAVNGWCGGLVGVVVWLVSLALRVAVDVMWWCRGKAGRSAGRRTLQRSCPSNQTGNALAPKDPTDCSQLNPRPSPTASQSVKTARRTDESKMNLSDRPHEPSQHSRPKPDTVQG